MVEKEIVINRAKWRTASHGEGPTILLNDEGYKCCLGFLVGQTTKCKIKEFAYPSECSRPPKEFERENCKGNNCLETSAIRINDNYNLTDKQREEQLIKLFSQKSKLYRLKFVGKYNKKTKE
jgi:hypothetical protein